MVCSSWVQVGIIDVCQLFFVVFCWYLQVMFVMVMQDCVWWWWLIEVGVIGVVDWFLFDLLFVICDLVIIFGIFGECVVLWVMFFLYDYVVLVVLGYWVSVVDVEGCVFVVCNVDYLYIYLVWLLEDVNVVIIVYFKGVIDVMLVVSQLQVVVWWYKVLVLIVVVGVVQGLLFVDDGYMLYCDLVWFDLFICDCSDVGGVCSLMYVEVMCVVDVFVVLCLLFFIYSVVVVVECGNVNFLFVGMYVWLLLIDVCNDGQVLLEDVVIFGSMVLGVFCVDYWLIVLLFEDSFVLLMCLFWCNNYFFCGLLVWVMLEFIVLVVVLCVIIKEEQCMYKVLVVVVLVVCLVLVLGVEEMILFMQVFFLVDLQIYNVYGVVLKQMFLVFNWVLGVVIWLLEVNLLVLFVLRYLLVCGMEQLLVDNCLVVVLGDGINIGCSGEVEVFDVEF